MTGRWLLDTNIVIALFAREDVVQQRLAMASELFVPDVALGELYYGARKSARAEANVARIEEFAASVTVLPCDSVTAWHYGEIKNRLRAKGRPLPENDLWIAAVACQHVLTLVSRDRHFQEIDGLSVEAW